MTRKHFKMIAEIISKIESPKIRKSMAEFNAEICAKANPRFNFQRFYAACNVGPS